MRSTDATRVLFRALESVLSVRPPFPWAVGYSGGKDSAVLLWALAQVSPRSQITALYVDHGWRSVDERAVEKVLVESWCLRLGVELSSFAPPSGGPLTEMAARSHRFQCFRSFLVSHPGSPVFLAHHADDQAETILMRILKGRSWQGLSGMAERQGPYIRPFLSLRASVLTEVARIHHIPFHEDSSNQDTRFSRNFLRRTVFPLIEERFPRAVGALGDFAALWSQVGPKAAADPKWIFHGFGATIASEHWDGWSSLERQAQLLAVASRCGPPAKFSRRFLETVTARGRQSSGQNSVWRWARKRTEVHWERVVHRFPKEYFIQVRPGVRYDLGTYSLVWETALSALGLQVQGVDGSRPWYWRSAVPGMRFSSADDENWGKEKRRKRLGALGPGLRALVIQDGLVRAVVAPADNRIVWPELGPGKLHKTGIFVTLVQRSDYERR